MWYLVIKVKNQIYASFIKKPITKALRIFELYPKVKRTKTLNNIV